MFFEKFKPKAKRRHNKQKGKENLIASMNRLRRYKQKNREYNQLLTLLSNADYLSSLTPTQAQDLLKSVHYFYF